MDIQQKTKEVEEELRDIIVSHLRENKIDVPTASKLARDFLAVLPIKNQQDLLDKLKELGTNYSEINSVYQQELAKSSHEKDEQALHQMRQAIQTGNIEHAITVAKTLQDNTQ